MHVLTCQQLQVLTGLHLRAGGVVTILTLFSLFVGWGSYMNIGFEHGNYKRSVDQCIILMLTTILICIYEFLGCSQLHAIGMCVLSVAASVEYHMTLLQQQMRWYIHIAIYYEQNNTITNKCIHLTVILPSVILAW